MACPSDYLTGIVEIRSGVSQTDLDNIKVNIPPFTIVFSPRNSPLVLLRNKIEESTHNTLEYKGIRYNISNPVQICKCIHTGYSTNEKPPVAELIISFEVSEPSSSFPTALFICFPIFESSSPKNANYLLQFVDSETEPQSLTSLFQEKITLLSYKSCFETTSNNTILSHITFVSFISREGIYLPSQKFQSIVTKISPQSREIPSFQIPSSIRNGKSTLYAYSFENGIKTVVSSSENGEIYKHSMTAGTPEFSNRYEYFPISPVIRKTRGAGGEEKCPSIQYKCVPMEMLRKNLTEKCVADGVTISKYLDRIDQEKENSMNSEIPEQTISTETIESIIGGSIGLIAVVLFAFAIEHFLVKQSKH